MVKDYFCPSCGVSKSRWGLSTWTEGKGRYDIIHRRCKKCGTQVISTRKILENMMYKEINNK